MPCEHRDGMIVCSRNRRPQSCKFCRQPSTKQCDFPVSPGKTCDVYMCDYHANRVGDNVDYCPNHFTPKVPSAA